MLACNANFLKPNLTDMLYSFMKVTIKLYNLQLYYCF